MADGSGGYSSVRRAGWAIAGCGLLVAAGLSASPRVALDGNPVPSAGQVQAAQNRVNERAAALGKEEERLAAANARLMDLQTQAEILTEQYDKTVVAEQQAAAAYSAALRRLAAAESAKRSSRRQVAILAAGEFETEGGFDPMAAMLGDAHGIQAYFNQIGLGQVFASRRTDTLARNDADNVVAGVFRSQARASLQARRAGMRHAAQLKTAIEAAVARQLAAVRATRSLTARLSGQLASARTKERALASARQAALAAQAAAAARAAAAAQAAAAARANSGPSNGSPDQAPSWAGGAAAGSDQGSIAADWALSQLGRPYQWGAAGPYTYDCSGLTMVAWAQAGVTLLHYTGYQWEEGVHVPLDQLQRGDLLFYATDNSDPATIHHVGIYIGNGEMVDAPYTGAYVRIDSIYAPGVPIGAVRP
ncbi:MAG TPA: C40 family peptidase [Streptosporangiaceae bacterium]|nr:C40 family peptidase [Streptosporangiaceae bacterium]